MSPLRGTGVAPANRSSDVAADRVSAPIFIVGMPRSGTSLLSRLLSGHPDIAIAPETHFVHDLYARYREVSLSGEDGFKRVWGDYVAGRRFPDLQLEAGELAQRFLAGQDRSWRGLFSCLLDAYAEGQGKPRCGEKTPDHYRWLRVLLDWYPQARVVFVWRDPRAVAASLLVAPFGAPYAWFHARRWRRAYQEFGQWREDSRVFAVRYEDLVTTPTAELARLMAFLDVTPAPLAELPAAPATERGGWYREHLRQAGAPVSMASRDRWRRELSRGEHAAVELLLAGPMRDLGYAPALGPARWFALPGLLMRIPQQQLLLRLRDLAYRDERLGAAAPRRAGDRALRFLLRAGRWLSVRRQRLDFDMSRRLPRRPFAVALEVAGDDPEDCFRSRLSEIDELIGMLARRLLEAGQPVCLLNGDQAGRLRALHVSRAFHLHGRAATLTDPNLRGRYRALAVQTSGLAVRAGRAGLPVVRLPAGSSRDRPWSVDGIYERLLAAATAGVAQELPTSRSAGLHG